MPPHLLGGDEGPGEPVTVEVDSRVAGVDDVETDRPVVRTVDGRRFGGDVVIGADGINSAVRAAIGGPSGIVQSGDMAYRTLIRAEQVREDPATRWIFDWPAANFWLGDNRHVVMYPVRDVGFVNVVEAKELICTMDCPYIVARGRKGGSNLAAAIVNALLYTASKNERE